MDELVVERFRAAARAFCDVVEHPPAVPLLLIRRAHRALVQLYAAALDLPDVFTDTELPEEELEHPRSTGVGEALEAILGDRDEYRLFFDPTVDELPLTFAVSADLQEIYEDVLQGLTLLDRHGASPEVVWEIRWDYAHHWSRHAVHVLAPLRELTGGSFDATS